MDYKNYTKEDWDKLNSMDWVYLLIKNPQYAKHCDWYMLSDYDWDYLLKYQPQFEKYKVKVEEKNN